MSLAPRKTMDMLKERLGNVLGVAVHMLLNLYGKLTYLVNFSRVLQLPRALTQCRPDTLEYQEHKVFPWAEGYAHAVPMEADKVLLLPSECIIATLLLFFIHVWWTTCTPCRQLATLVT